MTGGDTAGFLLIMGGAGAITMSLSTSALSSTFIPGVSSPELLTGGLAAIGLGAGLTLVDKEVDAILAGAFETPGPMSKGSGRGKQPAAQQKQ